MLHRVLPYLFPKSPKATDLGLLVLRVWFGGVLALTHGWVKVANWPAFVDTVAKQGIPVPGFNAAFATLSEFVGGLCLAIGFLSRAAAASVVGTLLVAALWIHRDHAFSKQEFALAYAIAGLVILIAGPGRYSVDGWLRQRL